MSKFLTNIFGNKSGSSPAVGIQSRPHVTLASAYSEGRLETDAATVDDDGTQTPANSILSCTPSASADMTANMLREMADPNYNDVNSAEDGNLLVEMPNEMTTNMNVHSAQQQVVMQFSNVNQLHFGSVYNFNSSLSGREKGQAEVRPADVGASGTNESKRQTPRKTTSVVAMMRSEQELDHRMLETIATHLGDGWKLVMRNLGHSEGQIEQAIIDHQMHGGIKEVIYQLLLQWLRNADDGEATIGRITYLLWHMNHRECVQRMKMVFKSNSEQKT